MTWITVLIVVVWSIAGVAAIANIPEEIRVKMNNFGNILSIIASGPVVWTVAGVVAIADLFKKFKISDKAINILQQAFYKSEYKPKKKEVETLPVLAIVEGVRNVKVAVTSKPKRGWFRKKD